ncbi:NACHT domain-containing protein [Kitasatospora sp. NPDC058965]|uniref:NACHT domain-containing protein n=1 Tax=Kitasatospora sp. NPDC058965 TaxID=3346682 RepID=UPI0036A9989F
MWNQVHRWGIELGVAVGLVVGAVLKEWITKVVKAVVDGISGWVYRRFASSALLRRTALRRYLRSLHDQHATFRVSFDVTAPITLHTADVYVPLQLTSGQVGDPHTEAALRKERHSVVLGVPGAGKTMLLRHEVLSWVRSRYRPQSTAPPKRLLGGRRAAAKVDLRDLSGIPVLLELHRLNSGALDLPALIVDHLDRHQFPNAAVWVDRALRAGQLALYLDGFDEVATDRRQQVADQILHFAQRHPDCRIVVTCRIAVYEGQFNHAFGQTLQVRDFDEHLIRRFLRTWRDAGSAQVDEETAEQLLGALRDNPQLMQLARNPLLLTMIAYLYTHVYAGTEDALPHTRAGFYRQVTDHLLSDRRGLVQPFPVKVAVLQQLALAAQDIPSGSHDRLALPEDLVLKQIRLTLETLGKPTGVAEELLREIVDRSGLLLAVDHRQRYQFAHLTLQEYLAARELANDPDALLARYRADPSVWQEAVRLWCGLEARDCTRMVREVFALDPVLAFQCLADAYTVDEALAGEIIGHFKGELGTASGQRQEVVNAFGLVASARHHRGQQVFAFLKDAAWGQGPALLRDSAVRALAATNLPRAAEALAMMVSSNSAAASALGRMGDLGVPPLSRLAAHSTEALTTLWRIRTPRAALALHELLWTGGPEASEFCAWLLADLLTTEDIEVALRSAPPPAQVPADRAADATMDWVWQPFAVGGDEWLVRTVGRIARVISDPQFAPPSLTLGPDIRLVGALSVVRQDSGVLSETIRTGRWQALESLRAVMSTLEPRLYPRNRYAALMGSPSIPLMHLTSFLVAAETLAQRGLTAAELRALGRLAPLTSDALREAGMSEQRAQLLARLPERSRLLALASLCDVEPLRPSDWRGITTPPLGRGYDYDRSWHYRTILALLLGWSALAGWRAVQVGLGAPASVPPWLGWAALAQIVVAWGILTVEFVLTDHDSLLDYTVLPLLNLFLEFQYLDEDFWFALATLGFLPALGYFSADVGLHHLGPWGTVLVAAALLAVGTALRLRGRRLAGYARRADHPARRLLSLPA